MLDATFSLVSRPRSSRPLAPDDTAMCLGGEMLRPWAQALPGWATSAKSTLRMGLPTGAALAAGGAWPPLVSAATVAAKPRITSTSRELWELDRVRTAGRLLLRH